MRKRVVREGWVHLEPVEVQKAVAYWLDQEHHLICNGPCEIQEDGSAEMKIWTDIDPSYGQQNLDYLELSKRLKNYANTAPLDIKTCAQIQKDLLDMARGKDLTDKTATKEEAHD